MRFIEYIESPIFQLRRVWLAVQKAISEAFAEYALTNAQYEVLAQLWQQDALEQRELQARLGVTSATLTGVIDSLVERGLVERRPSMEDSRVKIVVLSAQGKLLEGELGAKTAAIQEQLLAGLSAAEATILCEWLKRMSANMNTDVCD